MTRLALTVSVAGCGLLAEQVPLPTDETVTAFGESCILMHEVADVTADPTSGTLVVNAGELTHPLKWPKGFTARRAWSKVDVLDDTGAVVLTAGARYWICPSEYLNGWVVGMVKPCPDCKLGVFLD